MEPHVDGDEMHYVKLIFHAGALYLTTIDRLDAGRADLCLAQHDLRVQV